MADPISGKDGTILISGTAVQELKNWKLSRKTNLPRFATNTAAGWKRSVAGVRDFSVTFEMLDEPTFDDGDAVTLVLYKVAGGAIYATVPVMIESIVVNTDIDDGEPISYSVNALSQGSVTVT